MIPWHKDGHPRGHAAQTAPQAARLWVSYRGFNQNEKPPRSNRPNGRGISQSDGNLFSLEPVSAHSGLRALGTFGAEGHGNDNAGSMSCGGCRHAHLGMAPWLLGTELRGAWNCGRAQRARMPRPRHVFRISTLQPRRIAGRRHRGDEPGRLLTLSKHNLRRGPAEAPIRTGRFEALPRFETSGASKARGGRGAERDTLRTCRQSIALPCSELQKPIPCDVRDGRGRQRILLKKRAHMAEGIHRKCLLARVQRLCAKCL